jgi:hypothetical protein
MKWLMLVFVGMTFVHCQDSNNSTVIQSAKGVRIVQVVKLQHVNPVDFDFKNFEIQKNQLGQIKIGTTINEAEKQFEGLVKKEVDAFCFGFDGGGLAYLYYANDEPIFGLIPKRGNDTVLCIIAAHQNLQTTNGLHPKALVSELLQKYPEMMIELDVMNMWNFFEDEKNEWRFVFDQLQEPEYGNQADIESPMKPKDLTMQSNWIAIY